MFVKKWHCITQVKIDLKSEERVNHEKSNECEVTGVLHKKKLISQKFVLQFTFSLVTFEKLPKDGTALRNLRVKFEN